MTVVHQPRTTFLPGIFIVSFLLRGITILWYSFPEEDYFSVSNFANRSFLGQSLQICIAMKQGSFPGIADCREKIWCLFYCFFSLHFYCWLWMYALWAVPILEFLAMKHKTKRNLTGFGFHYKIQTQPHFVWEFANILSVSEIRWGHLWLSLADLRCQIETGIR